MTSSFDDTAYRLVVGNNEPLGQMLDILNLIVPIEYTSSGPARPDQTQTLTRKKSRDR